MRTRLWTIVGMVGLVLGLVTAAGADATESLEDGSDNIRHVDNLEFPDSRPGGSRASDSDFLTWTAPADWQAPTETGDEPFFGAPEDYRYPEPGDTRVFNLMGTDNRGLYITDVTDPERAELVAHWDCGIWQADVFVFEQGEGEDARSYAAYTLDAARDPVTSSACVEELVEAGVYTSGDRGTFIVDVTDPYRPETVTFLPMRKGSHQTTVHPSGDYVYNSAAVLGTTELGTIEVYEIADLATRTEPPSLVDEIALLTGLDSHDMTFNDDGSRLYSAALTHSFVIDTSDPERNEIVGRIIDPAINIHHDAHVVTVDTPLGERDYLLLGDELAGAAGNGFCPGGGIHVYDVTGPLESTPLKVGAFFIPDVRPAGLGVADTGDSLVCTAHVIQVLPEQELLVMAWYNAGVRILDYSGLGDVLGAGPQVGIANESLTPGIQQVGYHRFADSNLWSAKIYDVDDDGSFYIFGGDTNRTLDIWHFDPNEDAGHDHLGAWMNPTEALRHMQTVVREAGSLLDRPGPYCLLD